MLSADEMNKIEFRGQYASIRPTGLVRVDFQDGETYQWNPLVTVIQHIILGKVHPCPLLHALESVFACTLSIVIVSPYLRDCSG